MKATLNAQRSTLNENRSRIVPLALVGILLMSSAVGRAQNRIVLDDPALDALVAKALANSTELQAARAEAEAAKHRIAPAAALPDPTASVSYDGDRKMTAFMVSQAVPWPGKREAATEVARHEAQLLESGVAARIERSVDARVRNAWYDLVLARSLERVLDERRSTAQQIEEVARQRYAAGLGVQQDVIRAQVELVRLEEARSAQEATIAARTAELNRLAGEPVDQRIDAPATLKLADCASDNILCAPLQEVVSDLVSHSPDVQLALHAVESARLRLDVAQKNLYPDLVVSAGPMIGSMNKTAQIGAGISLPVWAARRQREQIADARELAKARAADVESVKRQVDIVTRQRVAQLEAATRVATLYAERIVPLDRAAFESSLASYASGKVPFTSVLDALNVLYADQATQLARVVDAARLRVAIAEASVDAVVGSATPGMSAPQSSSSSAMSGM